MGGTASATKAAVVAKFQVKEPPFDKILLKILVKNVPTHFDEINSAKMNFVDFCRILITRRENVLNEMTKSLQCSVNEANNKYLIDVSRIISYVIKILVFIVIALSLYENILLSKVCATLFCVSLTFDVGLYKYLRDQRRLFKLRLQTLIRTVEADREYLETARVLLNEFRKRFEALEKEIKDFVREVNMKFLDIKCKSDDVPQIKRFLCGVRHLKSDVKNDMSDFIKAFVELIDDFIAIQYIHEPEQEAKSAETYLKFVQRCQETFANAEALDKDLDLYYSNIDLTDSTNLGMLIISKDLDSSFDKINQMRQSLMEEINRLKKSIDNVKQKEKTYSKM